MGCRKEAIRMIMIRLPEWEDTHRTGVNRCTAPKGVRLDSDGEVVATTAASDDDVVDDGAVMYDFWSLGYISDNAERLRARASNAVWFVSPPNPCNGLIGTIFNRMEYEIFRAAILAERDEPTEANDGPQKGSHAQDTAPAARVGPEIQNGAAGR